MEMKEDKIWGGNLNNLSSYTHICLLLLHSLKIRGALGEGVISL